MRFNANNIEPQVNDFEPIPKGKYRLRIDEAEERDNSKGNGRYLWLALSVAEGPHKGRKLWSNVTTEHAESEDAVRIGLGQISAMARAIGLMSWNHEREIVGRLGEAYVGLETDNRGEKRNKVSGWVVPSAVKGAPTYTSQHQAHAAAEANVNQRGGQLKQTVYGGAATVATNRAPTPPPPKGDPGYYDDDVPF